MKETESQRIGEFGQNLFSTMLPKGWVPQRITPDYGEDFKVLIVEGENVTGNSFCVQVKTASKLKGDKKHIKLQMQRKDLQHWTNPDYIETLFLIAMDETKKEGYWLFLRQYLAEHSTWNSKKKPTIYIPRENNLTDIAGFRNAVIKALSYTKLKTAPPLTEVAEAYIEEMKQMEPRFNYEVTHGGKNQTTRLSAVESVSLQMRVVSNEEEVRRKFTEDFVGRGLPFDFKPGEFKIEGSPIFDKAFKEGGTLHMSREKPANISLKSYQGQELLAELQALPGKLGGGEFELTVETTTPDSPIHIIAKHNSNTCKVDFSTSIRLSAWEGKRLSQAKLFKSLVPFIASLGKATHVQVIFHVDGESLEVYQIPASDLYSRMETDDFVVYNQLLIVCRHFKIDPIVYNLRTSQIPDLFTLYDIITNGVHRKHLGRTANIKLVVPEQEVHGVIEKFNIPELSTIRLPFPRAVRIADETIQLPPMSIELDNVVLANRESLLETTRLSMRPEYTLAVQSTDATHMTITPDMR